MVERRIMNRPGEKVGGNPAPAGAENITVKPKTVEERLADVEEYARGIDPVIRSIINEIGEIKKTNGIMSEEITKIAGIQSRSNLFIDGKFEEINTTFNAIIAIVKKIDDDYQSLFVSEGEEEPEETPEEPGEEPSGVDDLYENIDETGAEPESEYLSTEPMQEYVEDPEPEYEPEPDPEPVVKPVKSPVNKQPQKQAQVAKPVEKPVPKAPVKSAPAVMPKPIAPTVRIQQKKVASKAEPLAPETQPRAPPTKADEEPAEENKEGKGFFGNIFKKKKENK